MRGLLADVHLQGHLPYLRSLIDELDLGSVLAELELELATFPDIPLDPSLDDRSLWNHCQREGWVLFTENRRADDPNSLQATLADSWKPGCLPVLTLANKTRFEHSPAYAKLVATHVAEVLFDIQVGLGYISNDQPRIYVPRKA
jgi:hypothetical protein